jgi:hypothetical protein
MPIDNQIMPNSCAIEMTDAHVPSAIDRRYMVTPVRTTKTTIESQQPPSSFFGFVSCLSFIVVRKGDWWGAICLNAYLTAYWTTAGKVMTMKCDAG